MSDLKLYRILETFDNLESAADKLTPVDEAQTPGVESILSQLSDTAKQLIAQGDADVGDLLDANYTEVDGFDLKDDIRVLMRAYQYARQRGVGDRAKILNTLYDAISDELLIDEAQTKVQTIGNKVKVTTGSDTTEFDDAETAAAFMGDDGNEFATEDALEEGVVQDVFSFLWNATGKILDSIPVLGDERKTNRRERELELAQEYDDFVASMDDATVDNWIEGIVQQLQSSHPASIKAAARRVLALRSQINKVRKANKPYVFVRQMQALRRQLADLRKFIKKSNSGLADRKRPGSSVRQFQKDLADEGITEDLQGTEVINYDDFALPKTPNSDIEVVDYDNITLPSDIEVSEGNEDSAGSVFTEIRAAFPDDDIRDIRGWVNAAVEFDEPLTVDAYSEWRMIDDVSEAFDEAPADEVFGDWFQDDDEEDMLYDPQTNNEFPRADLDTMSESEDDDGVEFATFDSDNEGHRKRLQRGTPVVLSPEVCSDPKGNRRGIFVNRSPSGFFGTVVRDCDGKEIKVHLSDIVSADLVNNSIYEEFDLNFEKLLKEDEDFPFDTCPDCEGTGVGDDDEDCPTCGGDGKVYAKKLKEDITLTQTTNLENPENDTTTVTAVGHDAGEELAAMMANAGLNSAQAEMQPVGMGDEVDTGEPEMAVPQEMPMQDMMSIMDEPEVAAEGMQDQWADETSLDMHDSETWSEEDFDAAMPEPEPEEISWDLGLDETDVPIHTPMTRAQAMAADTTNSELEKVLTKFNDSDILDWLEDGNDAVDEALFAISTEDMPYGTQKARTGDPQEWLYDRYGEEIDQYAKDNFGPGLGESEGRDIEYTNTPGERTSGVDAVLQGGGLNRSKRMYQSGNRWGDNGMLEADEFDPMDVDEPTMRMVQTPDGPKWVSADDDAGDFDTDMSLGYDDNMVDVGYDDDEFAQELDFNESDPKQPASADRVRGILNTPDLDDASRPKSHRYGQQSRRKLRGRYGMQPDTNAPAGERYSMYDDASNEELLVQPSEPDPMDDYELEEELSPKMQAKKKRDQAPKKAAKKHERDNRRYAGSRLTGNHRNLDGSIRTEFDEASPDMPAVRDRSRGILNEPDEEGNAKPFLKRRAQRSRRYLRSKHGMTPQRDGRPVDMYSMYEAEWAGTEKDGSPLKNKTDEPWASDEEERAITCPQCGTINDTDDMRGDSSCEECGAELFDESANRVNEEFDDTDKTECPDCGELYDPSMDTCPNCEEKAENKLVNEHESVDNFLNLYKAFKIRGEKK